MEWNFRKLGINEGEVGDHSSSRVLQTGDFSNIEVLARETGQNTKNQPIDENIPVDVCITLIELTGETKINFLEAMQWENLKKHLNACTEKNSNMSLKLKEGIKIIENESLKLLRVDDYNSRGLNGPDQSPSTFDDENIEANFFNLCKADFVTDSNAKSSRGGSYGVGKSFLWHFSCISTVLFSSMLKENKNNKTYEGLRLFGRSELITHTFKSHNKKERYQNMGYFGVKDKNDEQGGVVSSWNDKSLADKLFLNRDESLGTGASILIVGYHDPDDQGYQDPQETLNNLKQHVEEYFWPSITPQNKSINFNLRYQRNNRIVANEIDELSIENYDPFVNAIYGDQNIQKIANTENSIARKPITIKIPERIDLKKHKPFIGNIELSVHRSSDKFNNNKNKNKIAFIRGFGMVVNYYTPKSQPFGDSLPYFATLRVGTAIKDQDKDIANKIEDFFKFSEPPLHDKWHKQNNGLKNRYKDYSKSIDDFYKSLEENLLELCGEEELDQDTGPELLSKMLNIGFKPTKNKTKIISKDIVAYPDVENLWKVAGTIEIQNPKKDDNGKFNWGVEFGFSVKEESNKGENCCIDKMSIKLPDQTDDYENCGETIKLKNLENIFSIDFEGTVNIIYSSKIQDQISIVGLNKNIISLGFYLKS